MSIPMIIKSAIDPTSASPAHWTANVWNKKEPIPTNPARPAKNTTAGSAEPRAFAYIKAQMPAMIKERLVIALMGSAQNSGPSLSQ